ncbi:dimeric dihydrodiol [Moniliophthora roreri MCA 2997]|uniref:Dimeric dihydrodiol n=1 Tax=Moniliophthora roreri (strain MCA 2997) TaxID=1381753 RepID=V2XWE9_MONRO|nr:dimeric dihydrodiol [Moniliophthora roreri MCA 2997]
MPPIRLGFVGLSANGWAASTLVPPLLEEPLSSKYTIAAVSTTNQASANASAEKYSKLVSAPVKAYYGSTEQIANDPDVDMVAVSVRTPAHVDAALPALQAKKDLFIEWPTGNQLAGTTKIAEMAKKGGVRTLIGFQTRQAAYVRKVKEILESGLLGRIISTSVVTCSYFLARGPFGYEGYRYLTDTSNGASMVDINGGHLIDVLHYLFGPVASITSYLANQYPTIQMLDASGKPVGDPIPQDDIHQVVFGGQFDNKDATVFSVNIRNVGSEHSTGLFWIIDGEKGAIKIKAEKGLSFMRAQPELWVNGEKVDVETDSEAERSARNWSKFADRAEGEYATVDDALKAKKVVDAIFRSSREGRRVDL